MKKLTAAAILTVILFSCKKEVSIEQPEQQSTKFYIQVVAVDFDGTETYSPIIITR